jgi:DnaJ-class molecular chaperone
MDTFRERKACRKAYYDKYVHGWKLRDCTACNGSGYYDHNGSPACGACDGTGKERYKPAATNQGDKQQ